jgi:hypothetical protein
MNGAIGEFFEKVGYEPPIVLVETGRRGRWRWRAIAREINPVTGEHWVHPDTNEPLGRTLALMPVLGAETAEEAASAARVLFPGCDPIIITRPVTEEDPDAKA